MWEHTFVPTRPLFTRGPVRLYMGDCVEVMASLPESSIDAVVCDPPYGLEFMGKDWDRLDDVNRANRGTQTARKRPAGESGTSQKFQLPTPAFDLSSNSQRGMQAWHERWAREALRVLKPGGYLLAFGGTRTYHRLACAIEDAGFEIRDEIMWMYGQGFPKSLDVSKAVDKAKGETRTVLSSYDRKGRSAGIMGKEVDITRDVTAPSSPEAAQWSGWGTALKPAHEPIVVARKPLIGTVAKNVLEHGTGAMNIDASRVGFQSDADRHRNDVAEPGMRDSRSGFGGGMRTAMNNDGRWPANLILSHSPDCIPTGTRSDVVGGGSRGSSGFVDGYGSGDGFVGREVVSETWECVEDCPVAMLDAQSGTLTSGKTPKGGYVRHAQSGNDNLYGGGRGVITKDSRAMDLYGDTGGASRFFYHAKSSTKDRTKYLPSPTKNPHPTVKPIALMSYLIRLVTPPGATILDPFMGSGTTGLAAVEGHGEHGWVFYGIERDTAYFKLAMGRIAACVRECVADQAADVATA